MLDLKPDAEFAVPESMIAELTGASTENVQEVLLIHHMAFADGSLAVRAAPFFNSEGPDRIPYCHIEIADDAIRALDLSGHTIPHAKERFAENDWTSIPMGDDVLYVQGTEHAFLVTRGRERRIREVRIERGLGYVGVPDGTSARLRPSRNAHPVSQDYSGAISLSCGGYSQWLAMLTLDREALTARWSLFPGPEKPATGHSFLSVLFGRRSAPSASPLPEDLIQLDPDDFPRIPSPYRYAPSINEALLRDGRIFVYTKGISESPGRGHECSDIAEIGSNGRIKARLLGNDYTKTDDARKRGIKGRFTSSGRYCILSPIYQSTDPWKGAQKLFDMDSGKLADVRLPRGYTKFRLIDHAGPYFWAEKRERGQPDRLMRFVSS